MKIFQVVTLVCYFYCKFSFAQILPSSTFEVAGLKIEEATFLDVKKVFGFANMKSVDSTEHSDLYICYRIKNGKGFVTIKFFTGPMGGWERVTGFFLSKRAQKKCSPSEFDSKKITVAGFGLSSKRLFVLRSLNIPEETKLNFISLEDVYIQPQCKITNNNLIASGPPVKECLDFDVIDTISLKFSRERLTEISVQKLVSY
jgi:hypothetical protein